MYYAVFYRDWSLTGDLSNIRSVMTGQGQVMLSAKHSLASNIRAARARADKLNAERLEFMGDSEEFRASKILGFTLHHGAELGNSPRVPGTRIIAVDPAMQYAVNEAVRAGRAYMEGSNAD